MCRTIPRTWEKKKTGREQLSQVREIFKLSYFTVTVKEGCSHSLRVQGKYHKSYFSIHCIGTLSLCANCVYLVSKSISSLTLQGNNILYLSFLKNSLNYAIIHNRPTNKAVAWLNKYSKSKEYTLECINSVNHFELSYFKLLCLNEIAHSEMPKLKIRQ